jgi:hypothetical protein
MVKELKNSKGLRGLVAFVGLMVLPLAAEQVADLGRDGIDIKVDAEPAQVDVARDFFVTLTFTSPAGMTLALPDLRDRFTGFRVAEDFTEDPIVAPDGSTTLVSRWRLVPEPVAPKYRLAPFVVTVMSQSSLDVRHSSSDTPSQPPQTSQTSQTSFYTSPVYFTSPAAREPVTGDMEIDPKKDLPPLSWKLVGWCALALVLVAALALGVWWTIKKIREMVRVHRMSPIERAYYELDRLLKKGLPGRGLYKDFYVELTMVVRRYVERKYGVKAPNMTTQEFLGELARRADDVTVAQIGGSVALKEFLESADLVKFAGVEATPEMADSATGKARSYLSSDSKDESAVQRS